MNTPNKRLASLDILRGFILFLLVFFQPVACSLLQTIDTPWAHTLLYQLDHEVWAGFRFWDLVMPLFLFISGASMPFSFSKLMREGGNAAIYKKVAKRFFILWLLGMVVQGNLLGFNPNAIYLYTNTLQAIAAGYLITALIITNWRLKGQTIAAVVLLLAYAIPMMLRGDYSPEGNLAGRIDAAVLGRFRGDPTYSWLLSSLTFGVTVWLGALSDYRNEHQTTASAGRYKRYADEEVDNRITNPQIEGNVLLMDIDHGPRIVTLPQTVVEAYNEGALTINTIANRILARADQMSTGQQRSVASSERYEQSQEREQSRGIR